MARNNVLAARTIRMAGPGGAGVAGDAACPGVSRDRGDLPPGFRG